MTDRPFTTQVGDLRNSISVEEDHRVAYTDGLMPPQARRATTGTAAGGSQSTVEQIAPTQTSSQPGLFERIRARGYDLTPVYVDMAPARQNSVAPQLNESTRAATRYAENWKDIQASVFKMETDSGEATVWLSEQGTLITDSHCVEGARQFTLIGHDGKRYPLGGDVWLDPEHDLAVITPAPGVSLPEAKPLPLGSSVALRQGDPIQSFGFPGFGSPADATRTDGTYAARLANIDLYKAVALSFGVPAEIEQYRQLEAEAAADPTSVRWHRSLVALNAHLEQGNSGGPNLDNEGRVVAVSCKNVVGIDRMAFSTPVEDLKALLNHDRAPGRYQHVTGGHFESGVQTSFHNLLNHPLQGRVINNAAIGAAGVAGGTVFLRDLTSAGSLSATSAMSRVGGLAASAFLSRQTYSDVANLTTATTSRDTLKYTVASGSDAAMFVGAAGMVLNRFGTPGKAIFAAGLLTRLGAELLPNNFVVDIGKFDKQR